MAHQASDAQLTVADDNMEISSDAGQHLDYDIDIDVDVDGSETRHDPQDQNMADDGRSDDIDDDEMGVEIGHQSEIHVQDEELYDIEEEAEDDVELVDEVPEVSPNQVSEAITACVADPSQAPEGEAAVSESDLANPPLHAVEQHQTSQEPSPTAMTRADDSNKHEEALPPDLPQVAESDDGSQKRSPSEEREKKKKEESGGQQDVTSASHLELTGDSTGESGEADAVSPPTKSLLEQAQDQEKQDSNDQRRNKKSAQLTSTSQENVANDNSSQEPIYDSVDLMNQLQYFNYPLHLRYHEDADPGLLFPVQVEDGDQEPSILDNRALIAKPLAEVFEALRAHDAYQIPEDNQMRFYLPALDIGVSEDSQFASTGGCTLLKFIEVYMTLCRNDGNFDPEILVVDLIVQPSFYGKWRALLQAYVHQKGLSEVVQRGDSNYNTDEDYLGEQEEGDEDVAEEDEYSSAGPEEYEIGEGEEVYDDGADELEDEEALGPHAGFDDVPPDHEQDQIPVSNLASDGVDKAVEEQKPRILSKSESNLDSETSVHPNHKHNNNTTGAPGTKMKSLPKVETMPAEKSAVQNHNNTGSSLLGQLASDNHVILDEVDLLLDYDFTDIEEAIHTSGTLTNASDELIDYSDDEEYEQPLTIAPSAVANKLHQHATSTQGTPNDASREETVANTPASSKTAGYDVTPPEPTSEKRLSADDDADDLIDYSDDELEEDPAPQSTKAGSLNPHQAASHLPTTGTSASAAPNATARPPSAKSPVGRKRSHEDFQDDELDFSIDSDTSPKRVKGA